QADLHGSDGADRFGDDDPRDRAQDDQPEPQAAAVAVEEIQNRLHDEEPLSRAKTHSLNIWCEYGAFNGVKYIPAGSKSRCTGRFYSTRSAAASAASWAAATPPFPP